MLAGTGYKLGATSRGHRQLIDLPGELRRLRAELLSKLDHPYGCLVAAAAAWSTIATSGQPNNVQEPTVWAFYSALSEQRFDEGATSSTALPPGRILRLSRSKAGLAATETIEVGRQPGPTPTEVLIDLRSHGRQPVAAPYPRFRGTWTLIWSGEQQRWLLDRARIEQVS